MSIIRNDASRSASNNLLELLKDIQMSNKDPELTKKLQRCYDIVTGQEEYVEQSASEESKFRLKIVNNTYTDPMTAQLSGMLSGNVVGACMKMIAEMVQAKTILEIGMFTGYGTVTLAESAFCNQVVSLDVNPYMETFLKERIKGTDLENKIRIIIGPGIDSLVTLKKEGYKFDLVFIDADKPGYIGYYKYIMDNALLSPTGVFLCDNMFYRNDAFLDKETENGKALNEFVKFVRNDNRVDQLIFPFRDGVMLVKPKVKA